jgi:invasion protein IalB
LGAALAAQVAAHAAFAQEATSTTATYGSWVVRCQRQNEGGNVCEMAQTLASEKDRKVVAQVAIGQLPKNKTPRAVIQVPVGADLTKPPSLNIGEKAQYPGRYVVCTQRFCRAEIDLPAHVVQEMATAKKASISFTLLGKTIVVTMTTDGMAVAFDKALKGTK